MKQVPWDFGSISPFWSQLSSIYEVNHPLLTSEFTLWDPDEHFPIVPNSSMPETSSPIPDHSDSYSWKEVKNYSLNYLLLLKFQTNGSERNQVFQSSRKTLYSSIRNPITPLKKTSIKSSLKFTHRLKFKWMLCKELFIFSTLPTLLLSTSQEGFYCHYLRAETKMKISQTWSTP